MLKKEAAAGETTLVDTELVLHDPIAAATPDGSAILAQTGENPAKR